MNTKLFVLLGGVGAVHLVAGALFIAGGCAQEDPPMPPGIYVPKQSANEPAGPAPAPAEPVGQAGYSSSTLPPEPAPTVVSTETAAPAPAPAPAPRAKTESRGEKVYIVVKNDSLWLIARKHGLTIEELASYNSLSPKAKLRVGQKLYIPPTGKKGVRNAAPQSKGKGKAAPVRKGKKGGKPAGKSAKAKLPADGIYTVREHDNFSTIAKRFGIKVSDIIAANPGVDSSRLRIGQKIRLTAGAAEVSKKKAKAPAKKEKAPKAAKAAKPASAAAPAPDAAPAGTDAAAPTPAAAPAPAAEKKSDAGMDDPEALLNTVKQPQENPAPEAKKDNAPAAPQAKAAGQDKDRLIKGKNGQLSVVLGEDITLARFCRKFTVSEHVIRSQNENIPADGRLKAGTSILLIAEDDVI